MRRFRTEDAYLIAALLVAAAAGLAIIVTGCGPTARHDAHTALDIVTDVADPSYALAVERVIVDRPDTTEAADRADLAHVREVCDPILAGFEALRIAQREARALIDAEGEGDLVTAAIDVAARLWRDLQELVPGLADLGGGA